MKRKISDRISANDNSAGNEEMSAAEAFGPMDATVCAREMIERESRGSGDQMNAYERVASRCGLTARQLRRFLSGDRKEPGWTLINGIRTGWVTFWEDEFAQVKHKLEIAKRTYGSDHFEDFDAQVQALDTKIQAAKLRAQKARERKR